jgi:hypothetical protein
VKEAMAMRAVHLLNLLKRAGKEFVRNLAWLLAAFGVLGVILVFATHLPLLGVLAFVGIFASVIAAIATVVALWSGAHDETFLSGRNHHPGSPPDRGGDWAGGGWGDGAGGGGDGGGA